MTPVKPCSKIPFPFTLANRRQSDRLCSYALSELQKDVEAELLLHPESERESLRSATKFAVFVVHNKKKPKLGHLAHDIRYDTFELYSSLIHTVISYFAGEDVEDVW